MNKILLGAFGIAAVAGSILFVQLRIPAAPNSRLISDSIDDLASCDYQVREQAGITLKELGPEATALLIRALQHHESPIVQRFTPWLRRFSIFTFKPTNAASLREKAAEQLGQIENPDGHVIESLVLALRDENEDVLLEVQRALRRIGPRTIPQLTQALRHRNPRIRGGAAQVLGDFGPQASSAAPNLVARLHDKKPTVRAEAAKALGRIASDDKAVTALAIALEDSSPHVRSAAAEALGAIGPTANAASPKLITRFSDRDTKVRIASAKAIWLITGRPELSVPVLIRALKDPEAGGQATFVLGEIGNGAKDAIPALLQALQAEKVYRPLRTPPSTALALGRIGAAAVPGLVPLLDSGEPSIRISSAIALGFIGAQATNAIPNLVALLWDKELEVRQASVLALGSIHPANPAVIPALKQLAHDDDIFLASSAAAMLRDVDPTAASELGLEAR